MAMPKPLPRLTDAEVLTVLSAKYVHPHRRAYWVARRGVYLLVTKHGKIKAAAKQDHEAFVLGVRWLPVHSLTVTTADATERLEQVPELSAEWARYTCLN